MPVATLAVPTVRELPADEWSRLQAFEPFASAGFPDPASHAIIVAEDAGQIVAYWGIFTAVHVEPLWVHPSYRARSGLIRRLWRGVWTRLRESAVTAAFATILDADAALNLPPAQRLGFVKVPGDLYVIGIDAEEETP